MDCFSDRFIYLICLLPRDAEDLVIWAYAKVRYDIITVDSDDYPCSPISSRVMLVHFANS